MLLMAAMGALIGTFVGVLPGLGPTSAIAILLPVTAVLEPTQGVIMLAGIYYGAMYGGSTTAILLNIPGEISSVPTCLDGYPLAKKGKGGPALGISAISSFVAGIMGVIGLVFFAPVLADQALKFGPPEYFALMILALTLMVSLSGGSLLKSFLMGAFGYALALVGLGPSSGMPRFDYGISKLVGGFDMISIIIGLFAITEVLKGIEEKRQTTAIGKPGSVYPSKSDLKKSLAPMMRGGLVGFFLGLLPGCSAAITSFLAYDLEKKVSKHPEQFGKGTIEGVAAPEAANNATSSAGFIPLFSLGIPSSPPLAILLAGLMIYGLTPGPVLFEQNAMFVWTVIASMFVGNAMLLVLNLPLVWLWVKLTRVPYGIMAPVILMFCTIGAYSVRNNLFDVLVAYVFGGLGYLFHRYKWPVVPLVLCFILGPLLEESFIQTMAMGSGNLFIVWERPISLVILIAAAALLLISIGLNRRTQIRVKEEGRRGVDVA
ncbi:tripartite tricarboxylate transporter permease [Brevibacillus agri]|uniref:tripartite tricarboxylate transporter permease n=1 Tax=Brevibacillus agri TaxID=51101 RepID=UPI002E23A394|nr:tripartite tricarboxylate transporter permease [Brevibacillus agri]MED1657224.1 tripartite tricarboxylate transporter permease [Brevibacillus agri]MED1689611.1 tripartite tricarboxylate transporter permease [Brevibacillus agri]MED1693897.1 tripartite tricarboxylate transporter permease [Brevibacillus agri]MED1698273.1 tripartite tricarboxylate transporter permease [Brevibacillus agri]